MNSFEILALMVWLFPIFVLCCIIYGYLRNRYLWHQNPILTSRIIIQITTLDNYDIVNRNVATIRSYDLCIPYEIWIVTESSLLDKYDGADKVLNVSPEFVSKAKYKARALDYSSRVRENLGINSKNVKILFLDDDTVPSKEYIETCYAADYDVMQGILQPKLNYGTLYSYVENMRTLACLSVCSIYQSHGHPVWVHGEGICVKASTERAVGWGFNLVSSEDLVFGHKCAEKKMKWGFIWKSIYITSPWTFRDFFKQRKRWLWGNAHAISHILNWKSKVRLLWFYATGVSILWISTAATILDLTGNLGFGNLERTLFYFSLFIWLGMYGYIGYLVGDGKLKHILLSMVLAWFTSIMNTFPICVGLFLKRPNKFEVIEKERKVM
jgi:cellulose synthase/poly-beta-1,6-N-acetylglucosamine synthase-like glycosyltransferase